MTDKKQRDSLVHDTRSNFGLKGWWIIILTAFTMFTFCTVCSLSMNVVPGGKALELGVSEATLRAINTPAGIVGLFVTVGLSSLARRLGLKTIHVITLIFGAVVTVFWGLSNSIASYAVPVIFMFCLMSSTEVVTGKMLANWFPKKKGIATGWATMGLNAASIVMPGAMIAIMSIYGVRAVLFLLAGLLGVTAILTIVAYKDYPEQWNAFPDNIPNEKSEDIVQQKTGWNLKRLIGQKTIWLISISTGLLAMSTFGYVSSAVPSMLARNISPETAALMMSVASVFGFFGSYLCGWIDQKYGVKRSGIIICIWVIIGAATFFIPGTVGGWIFTIMLGVSIGGSNNYPISMTSQAFGRAGFQNAYAIVYLIKGFFQYGVYIFQSWSLNINGTYGPFWGVIMVATALSLVFFSICNVEPKRDPIEIVGD